MSCFKKTGSDSYTFNGDTGSPEKFNGRRDGIYTGTKLNSLQPLESIQEHPKSEEDYEDMKTALTSNAFLSNIFRDTDILDGIIKAMEIKEINELDDIILEGVEGSHMYVSSLGIYNIIKNGKKIGIFSDKRALGELSIMYKSKYPVTIRAVTKGQLWVLNRNSAQSIIIQHMIRNNNEMTSFLTKISSFPKERLQEVKTIFSKEYFTPDTVIVEEGHACDKFYMVNSGWAVGTKDKIGKVREYRRGDFFGEDTLVKDFLIDSTITAKESGVEFFTLTRKVFKNYFKQNGTTERKVLPFEGINQEVTDINITDLEKVETIGRGKFGKIDLVSHKTNKNVFILKYLHRADIVEFDLIENIYNEKNIQIKSNCAFIVRMFTTFKDNKYVYFLLEPCLGGDLWSTLRRQKNNAFSETAVKFYAACAVEALDYLHKRNCVYRHLKPENVVLDSRGYAKLTDFSFAKIMNSSKTYTFVGTPYYISPELIHNQGHDRATDYWTLGVLVYELLVGRTPFETNDPSYLKTYQMIMKGTEDVDFPKSLSYESIDIIKNLCKVNTGERLGYLRNGADDIRTHRLFYGFSWSSLQNRKMKTPFVPQLTHSLDTRYFDKYDKDDYIPPDDTTNWPIDF